MDAPYKTNSIEYENWEFPQLNELAKGMEEKLLDQSNTSAKIDKTSPGLSSSELKEGINIDLIKEEAFQAGILEGIKQEKSNTSRKDSRIIKVLQELNESKKSLSNDIEQSLLGLLEQIISIIFQHEIRVNFKHLERAIIDSVSSLEVKDKLYIYFNMKTIELLKESENELSSIKDIEVVEDDTLADGECKIKMDKSFIEIDLSKKLSSAIECLYGNKGT